MADFRVVATWRKDTGLDQFLKKLAGPGIEQAASVGLNEHAKEQRRMSIVRITAFTGVPKGRVSGTMKVIPSVPGPAMMASVVTSDPAIGLHEYGNPSWSQGTPVGASATAWNVRRQFPGAFYHGGPVLVRKGKDRYPLKVLSSAVLANELAKPSRPNVPAAEAYVAVDLLRRVNQQIVRFLGV